MNWWVKFGAKEEWFQKLAEEGKITKAWKSKPELYEDLYFIWEAFLMLSGPPQFNRFEPIPYTEILAYCELCQIPKDERVEIVKWIKFIFNEFVKIKSKQIKVKKSGS